MKRNQGFAIVELLLVLVVVGVIAFVAWRVIEANGAVDTAQNQVPQTTATAGSTNVPAANSASDLGKLQTQLNNQQVDDTSTSDLESQTAF
jgi:prepilin-type N-terminal cleavage/methylation domain-containing protein